MHPKRRQLLDTFFPQQLKARTLPVFTKHCRTGDEGMASWPQRTTQSRHGRDLTVLQAERQPLICDIKGLR
jgi:hypothetical protein